MKRLPALLALTATAALLLPLSDRPAFAAAPGNDRLGGAVAARLGFSQRIDTSQATTDADDRALARSCGPVGPGVTDASVWYSFVAAADGAVTVDVSASSYSAGVIVATPIAGRLVAQVCHPRAVTFRATAGATYRVLAFDDQGDRGGNGGRLAISFAPAPPGPANDVLAGAMPVSLGFSQRLDTSAATSDADDIAVNGSCRNPAGATDASVWYSYTATTDGPVTVDVSSSDYSAGVFVMTGAPGSSPALVCGPQSVTFTASAGTTYNVVTFDDQGDGGGNGGQLGISFTEGRPRHDACASLSQVPPQVLAQLPPQLLVLIDSVCHA